MLPLRDDNPTSRPAILTVLVILGCIGAYFVWQPTPFSEDTADARFTLRWAAIPDEVVAHEPLTALDVADTYGSSAAAYALCDVPASGQLSAEDSCVPDKDPWLALITSLFLHGSILHL